MIDLSQTQIAEDAAEQLPADWSQQLTNGLDSDYLVGYDADLDEAHVWFSIHRANAVQIPLSSLIDVTIDDETTQVIGFVLHQFAQIALAVRPNWDRFVVRDSVTGYPRLPDDIAMTPIQQLSSVVPKDVFKRTLSRAAHLVAA